MKKIVLVLFAIMILLSLVSCAAGPNHLTKTPDHEGNIAGFWIGLWHGIISPITFIISLFTSKVQFYEVHNNGGWYNFGFVLGAGILFGANSK